MRATLTINDDVAKLLMRVQQSKRASLKAVVNEVLRHGLLRMLSPSPPRRKFETPSANLGSCIIGNVDDVAEALAVAEGEGFR